MVRSKKFRVTLFLPSLLCLIAMLMAACGGNEANSPAAAEAAPNDQQIFRYPVGNEDLTFLDPALVQKAQDSQVIQCVFTGLVQFDTNGNVVDQLAKSHEISADGLIYTFHLRDGLVYSDGTPQKAIDIANSIDRALNPETKSEVSGYLILVKGAAERIAGTLPTVVGDGVKAPDDKTVVITITSPAAYFLQMLTYDTSKPINPNLIAKYGDKWTDHMEEGAGNGPFVVVKWDHTKGIELAPNPKYYGPQSKIQHVYFYQSGDRATTRNSYLSGQFDMTPVPSPNYTADKTRDDFKEWSSLVITYLSLNFLSKPLDNIKIRQALYLALDRELVAETVQNGIVFATNHIVPEGMTGYNDKMTDPAGNTHNRGDAAKAKTLFDQGLQEAGYANIAALPPLTMKIRTGVQSSKDAATNFVDQWKQKLGLTVNIEEVQYGALIQQESNSKGNDSVQIFYGGWQADYPDPQDWLSVFFAKGADYNNNNYGQNNSSAAAAQQEVQAQLVKADVETDPTKRLQMYADAEQKIITDASWIPLYQNRNTFLISPKLQNWPQDALGITPPDEWANIYISK